MCIKVRGSDKDYFSSFSLNDALVIDMIFHELPDERCEINHRIFYPVTDPQDRKMKSSEPENTFPITVDTSPGTMFTFLATTTTTVK